ncbi:hypothetical protein KAR91_59805 [Candidatus Pacearchaeota archaeon]|nr:hypothetical protein [Candidatus Pacearchaeota archaeon]
MTDTTPYYSEGFAAYPKNPLWTTGKKLKTVSYTRTITDAETTANDKYILSGPHSYGDRIHDIIGSTPAFTSSDDCNLGFYYKNAAGTFVELDADILWDGVDLSSALSYRKLLGTLNTSLDRTKNIGQILSKYADQEPAGGVYLVLEFVVPSTGGTVILDLDIMVEESTTN